MTACEKNEWPASIWPVLTYLADHLAAGYGRGAAELKIIGDPRFGRYCLWTGVEDDDPRLTEKSDLHEMIQFLNPSPSWSEAKRKYGQRWYRRSETARPGLNVTTLAAHSVVTGQLARVLSRLDWNALDPEAPVYDAKRFAQRGSFRLVSAHMRIDFPQRPFRVRDLGVFEQQRQALQTAADAHPDSILGVFGNECFAVFPSDEEHKVFVRRLWNSGFHLRERKTIQSAGDLVNTGLTQVLKDDWQTVYDDDHPPPDRIELPICESCQMAHALHRWPADHLARMPDLNTETRGLLATVPWRELSPDRIPAADRPSIAPWLEEWGEEDLCERCFTLRRGTDRFPALSEWEGAVAWLRIPLDIAHASQALAHLHREYLRASNPAIGQTLLDGLFVAFPLIVDFAADYRALLEAMHERLTGGFGQDQVLRPDACLWCVRLDERAAVLRLLDLFNDLIKERFPKLKQLPRDVYSPVRLAVSVAPVKHPFFVHWRFLQEPRADVSVQLVGSGQAALRLPDLERVATAVQRGHRRALHRLRTVAAASETLAGVLLRSREGRDRDTYQQLAALVPDTIDFQSMLTLANLKEA